LVISLIRNERLAERQDPPAGMDRWIRLATAVFWGAVLLSLNIQPVPVLGVTAALWLLGEALEWRLAGAAGVEREGTTLPVENAEQLEKDVRHVRPLQALCAAAVLAAWCYGYTVFRNFFRADVHHNLAIFFSKNGVWAKSPEFDARINDFPPEMQAEYREIGGALDHYHQVVRLNPFFPMAKYFIGNVYNDWGSTIHAQSLDAHQRGDLERAKTLRERAEEMWNKSLAMYDRLKEFAPNYVQTHHQVGLVYLKFADMEKAWGNEKKAEEYWDLALKNFALYRQLDPVFPPNYYRTAYIHFSRGEHEKAEQLYLDALKHNMQNVVQRIYHDRNAETYLNLGRMYYVLLVNKYPNRNVLPADAEEFKKAEKYYASAVEMAEKIADPKNQYRFDAMKGLAILYSRAQIRDKAADLWNRLRQMNPNDPDVQSVFRPQ
jgi:tetratricopeptide (TPR) repeat protein